jgi:hypothetical protein
VSISASLARYPGYLRRLLLHDSSFVLLGLAVLILVAGCILIFPRALVPDTLLDKQRTMPLGSSPPRGTTPAPR